MGLCGIMSSTSRLVSCTFIFFCFHKFLGVSLKVLLALQAVLANGDVVKTGSRARKSAAGSVYSPYNLKRI